ncbi:SDR family oxidoreductase [uncultured Vibrio sp.]|uniref:SDR family oxidoreductase n=1 Tax=uncultured Vibrio sp. TaxID=114054 RepID=UPI00091CC426|nr:SDR family oxidoreductase [uncultured Vibrio sp.]OIQ25867.1 MAG: short-chain dehydrogenase [Vibrio sp. MedPE-SWchi]
MDIKSAVILITSAGSLLGGTLATHFASLGAKLVLCDQDIQQLNETYLRCRAISEEVYYFQVEDYSLTSIHQLFDFVDDKFQRSPDVLVNNWPNAPLPGLISNQSAEQFSHKLTTLASTLFGFGQASAERMCLEKKQGVIVNVISVDDGHDLEGFENASSIVTGFTQSWAKELTPFNIRVGGVVPALSRSSKNRDYHWPQVRDELIRNTEYIVANDYFSGRIMAAEAS